MALSGIAGEAAAVVQAGVTQQQEFINDFLTPALTAIDDLAAFEINLPQAPTNITELTNALSELANSPALVMPAAPVAPTLVIPGDPGVFSAPALDAVPSITGTAPTDEPTFAGYNPPAPPGALTATVPTDAPQMVSESAVQQVVGSAPTVNPDSIPVPVPRVPVLPSAPVLNVPTFTAQFLGTIPTTPDYVVHYTEQAYDSQLLDDTRAQIERYFAGGTALPPAVEDALFNRARAREDVTAYKAVQEATEEWSSRGFEVPAGELQRMVQQARLAAQDAVNQLEREILIKQHQTEIENIRFAVQQGVALEGVLIQSFNQAAQRALEVAVKTADLAVSFYNSQIQVFNARVQQYATEAQVYKDRVDAERIKVENYRSQVEAAGLVVQMNETDVRIYSARIQALQSVVAIYTARVQAAQALVQVDVERFNVFKTRIDAFVAQVQAKTSEFQAWGQQIEAEGKKINAFQAQVQAFAERVRAFTAGVDAQKARIDGVVANNRGRIDAFNANLAAIRERFNAIGQIASAQGTVFGGQANIYSAQATAAKAVADVSTARSQITAAVAHDINSIELQGTQIQLDSVVKTATLLQAKLDSVAKVYAQLMAGAMSAVNYSSSLQGSGSGSESIQRSGSTNINVSEEGPDYSGPQTFV